MHCVFDFFLFIFFWRGRASRVWHREPSAGGEGAEGGRKEGRRKEAEAEAVEGGRGGRSCVSPLFWGARSHREDFKVRVLPAGAARAMGAAATASVTVYAAARACLCQGCEGIYLFFLQRGWKVGVGVAFGKRGAGRQLRPPLGEGWWWGEGGARSQCPPSHPTPHL